MNRALELRVNGEDRRIEVDPGRSLLSVLRDVLELTGTKYGCGEAQCGACTVLIDGRATRSCVTAVGLAEGKSVTTIEGLGREDALHPLQQAFVEVGAMQCGYCTPGMIVSAAALLASKARPSERDIVQHMDGNVCRCGTYPRIVRAIQLAATRMEKEGGR
jgi:aerobic-type carbon monoxide dehydrogenase small subunit (CoxS/CutS family)